MQDYLTAFGEPEMGFGAQDNPIQAGACADFLFFPVEVPLALHR